ncbi:MAG: 30S ribosomal protein S11, partial [Nanoarchaeota archaeon]
MENKKITNKQKISVENIVLPKEEKVNLLSSEEENQEGILEAEHGLDDGQKTKKTQEIEAIVHVYTSYNNTIAHVTDMSGRTIIKVSGGMVTKQDRLKANPTIAMFIAKRISEKMKEEKIKNLYLRVRAKTGNPAPGPGSNAIVKSLS